MYGDSYLDIDFKSVNDYFASRDKKGLMTVLKNKDAWDKSNIVFKNEEIIHYDKKEKTKDMEYIDYGLSMLRKSAFEDVPDNEILDLAALYKTLVEKKQMIGYEVEKRFYEIGSVKGLEETGRYIKKIKE